MLSNVDFTAVISVFIAFLFGILFTTGAAILKRWISSLFLFILSEKFSEIQADIFCAKDRAVKVEQSLNDKADASCVTSLKSSLTDKVSQKDFESLKTIVDEHKKVVEELKKDVKEKNETIKKLQDVVDKLKNGSVTQADFNELKKKVESKLDKEHSAYKRLVEFFAGTKLCNVDLDKKKFHDAFMAFMNLLDQIDWNKLSKKE